MDSVPVILVGDNPPSVHSEAFHVVGFFAPEAVIRREGAMGIDVHIAVIDSRVSPTRQAIVAALFLRNAGMTALIGHPRLVPADLVEPLHAYMAQAQALAKPVRTEVLIMEGLWCVL